MATACGTVVLRGFRELPPRERASLGWRYDVWLRRNGREGGFRVLPPGRRRQGGGASTTALQAKTAHRRPRIQNQKSMAVGLRGHINVRGAVAACRWVPGCRAVHWPTRCIDKGRGWMQY